MHVYCGIDYSLTSPAMVILAGEEVYAYAFGNKKRQGMYKFSNWTVRIDEMPVYSCEQERYENIAKYFIEKIPENATVRIEGYSYGSSGQVFHLAENCGILKYLLYKQDISFDVIAPPTVKKFATGDGRSDKAAMYVAICEKLKCDFKSALNDTSKNGTAPTADIVDAYYMALSLSEGVVPASGKK